MRPGANAKSSEGASRFEVLSPNRLKVLRASSKKDLPEHLSVRDAMLAVAKLEVETRATRKFQDGDTINPEAGIGPMPAGGAASGVLDFAEERRLETREARRRA